MKESAISKAIRYIMSLEDWRPKLRLATLTGQSNYDLFVRFSHELTQLQCETGLFPAFWQEDEPPSLRFTALAIDCLSSLEHGEESGVIHAAQKAIAELQDIDGGWSEEGSALGRYGRRQLHPGWSRALDRAELTASITSVMSKLRVGSQGRIHQEKAVDWMLLFLQEQEYETKKTGQEYSLNPFTLDLIVSALIECKIDPNRPILSDATNILRRNLLRALRRPSRRPWSLCSGTRTMLLIGGEEALLNEVADELTRIQRRDGAWLLEGGGQRGMAGEWTIRVLTFLHSFNPALRRQFNLDLHELMKLREFVSNTVLRNEETTRQVFLTRFEEVGVKQGILKQNLAFSCFLYSILEQFYWAVPDFDPQTEYLHLILDVGRLEKVGLDPYSDSQTIRKALFRSYSLRDQASARKTDVARSIALFASFLKLGHIETFAEFTLGLRNFALDTLSTLPPSWKRALLLGELLRLKVKEQEDPYSLMHSLENALKCFPGVGEKVSSLFLYYAGHVFDIWPDIPHDLVGVPQDWNIVKPFAMLGLTSVPLDQLKERPYLAEKSIQQISREFFPDDPGRLYGLWVVGHEWCARPWMCRDKAGRPCWLYANCPYTSSRK